MMFVAALDLTVFGILAAVLAGLAGGTVATAAALRPAERDRLQRIEHKLDAILSHLGVDYTPPAPDAWEELARDPSRKIEAIKAYRVKYGVGLAEAKRAVEDHLAGARRAD